MRDHPATTRAVVRALRRTVLWMQAQSPAAIAALTRPGPAADSALYRETVARNLPAYVAAQPMSEATAANVIRVVAAFEPAVARAALDPKTSFTNAYIEP
jgi:ABC-type nitrate/sulfonate/bicarbonate transport system substrate-binding protein